MIDSAKQEGREEGRTEGEIAVLRCLFIRRFGELPDWVDDEISHSFATRRATIRGPPQ
ncbi:MAG: hypothetical protein KJO08_10830 [Gammaproteobacteria bacterium]|nr:hypothetical protein [Gammaproteobacteria bacterium]NNJ84871.1 hypothetical protein [Gammaproteobacteria bacterium]